MRYTIEGFSQEYALTLQKVIKEKDKVKTIKVDGTDLIILRWFVDFYPNMAKIEIEGVQYAWINYKKLLDDMPLLDMGKHMLAIRLQKLCEFGILTHKTVKHGGSFSYYGFGANYHNLVERHSETNGDLMQNNADTLQNNADPLCNKVQTPCAINCNTNNSSVKDSSVKELSKKERKNGYETIIDSYTNNQNVKTAIIEYIKMRKLIKAPMTDRALTTLLNKLSGLAKTDSEKIAILNQAIEHSWKSVYPLEKTKDKPQEEPKVYAHPFDDGSDPEYTRRALEAQKRRGW